MIKQKRALNKLFFAGKLRFFLLVVMFMLVMMCGATSFELFSEVLVNHTIVKIGYEAVSFCAGGVISCVFLLFSDSFTAHYSAMMVLPVKKVYSVNFCIKKVMCIVTCMYIFEALMLMLNIILHPLKSIAALFVLAAWIVAAYIVYLFVLAFKLDSGKFTNVRYTAVIYAACPLFSAIKSLLYIWIAAAESGVMALALSIIILAATIVAAYFAKRKAFELMNV